MPSPDPAHPAAHAIPARSLTSRPVPPVGGQLPEIRCCGNENRSSGDLDSLIRCVREFVPKPLALQDVLPLATAPGRRFFQKSLLNSLLPGKSGPRSCGARPRLRASPRRAG
jgi:hypothetical protein